MYKNNILVGYQPVLLSTYANTKVTQPFGILKTF